MPLEKVRKVLKFQKNQFLLKNLLEMKKIVALGDFIEDTKALAPFRASY